MFKLFGSTVRKIRESYGLTREDLCGDQIELSPRQLARIENGESIPNLAKVEYIANRLGVSVGALTDGENFELPKRYQELKYQILRSPVYTDPERIKRRYDDYAEIIEHYYTALPEDEKLIMDGLQTILNIKLNAEVQLGFELFEDYFNQVKRRSTYRINDLILIELYLALMKDSKFSHHFRDENYLDSVLDKLLEKMEQYDFDALFVLDRILIILFTVYLKEDGLTRENELRRISEVLTLTVDKIHDYHRMPVVNLLEWKFQIKYKNDFDVAQKCYEKAKLFAELYDDHYLMKQLDSEWERDMKLVQE